MAVSGDTGSGNAHASGPLQSSAPPTSIVLSLQPFVTSQVIADDVHSRRFARSDNLGTTICPPA